MKHPFIQLLIRWSVLALGVTLATKLVGGIQCDDTTTLIIVVVLLSFFNAVLKPLLMLFALPFIVVTMGLGIVLINAVLFWLVGELVDGFTVSSFGAAFFGAIIVSLTNLLMSGFLGTSQAGKQQNGRKRGPSRKSKDDDVIDV